MKILHVVGSLDLKYGGPSQSVPGLCAGCLSVGLESTILTTDFDMAMASENCRQLSISSLSRPRNIREWFGFALELDRIISGSEANVLHLHGLWDLFLFLCFLSAKRSGLRVALSPRGMLEPWSLRWRGLKKKLALLTYQGRVLNNTDLFFATSDAERANILKLVRSANVVIIPNGISIANYPVIEEELLLTQSTDVEQRTALYLGRVHPKKGLDILLEAWARVSPIHWCLKIVGPSEIDEANRLQSLSKTLGVDHLIDFQQPVYGHMKTEIFRGADLFVLPSYSENFGISVLEALASGLPVITTTGTPWQVIQEEKCGWYIEPNVEDLTRALNEATSSDAVSLRKMGKFSRGVASNYDWREVGTMAKRAYASIGSRE